MFKKCEPSAPSAQSCHHLKISEIHKATKNFDESLVIGRGCFGKVYKGEVFSGTIVVPAAIKRLNRKSKVGATESWPEVDRQRLCTFRHRNIVHLIGYCNVDVKEVSMRRLWKRLSSNVKETILVYEYISNGTLKDHLHVHRTPLSWLQRLKICIGVARGLHYLHTAHTGVIHGDIRSSNILLTEDWVAKISDYGLSKLGPTDEPSTSVVTFSTGTFGYLDPYSLASGRLTRKSDVYSFGVVLLEVLCRKPAVDDDQRSLVTWVQDYVKDKRMETSAKCLKDIFGIVEGNLEDIIQSDMTNEISPKCLNVFFKMADRNLMDIVDSDIKNEISPRCLKDYFGTAERCLHEIPKRRPNMAEVVDKLESVLALQETFDNLLNSTQSVKEFTFNDLEKATRGFSRDLLLGEGGSGKVFLGWVDKKTLAPSEEGVGIAVAVKSITSVIPRSYDEWLEEVNFLGQLAHPNIIRLMGCCSRNGHEHMLVYEHVKKSLSQFIHWDEPLSWGTRLHIMIGVARGLTYLYSTKDVLCHFRSNDILLDEDFNAKIGGFGWVKIHERHDRIGLNGVFGYLKADYDTSAGHLLMKNDICSFGLVLLETITGRHLGDFEDVLVGLESLEMRAPKSKSNRVKLKKMMDPRLKHGYSLEGAFKCMALALRCIAIQPEYRPSREEILWNLEQIHALNK